LVTADDARQAESSEGQKLLPTFDGRPVELLAEGDFIKPQSLIAPCGFQFLGASVPTVLAIQVIDMRTTAGGKALTLHFRRDNFTRVSWTDV